VNIFDELGVPEKRRTPEYEQLLLHGDQRRGIGCFYGANWYRSNEKWLQDAEARMSPGAVALAERMAERLDELDKYEIDVEPNDCYDALDDLEEVEETEGDSSEEHF